MDLGQESPTYIFKNRTGRAWGCETLSQCPRLQFEQKLYLRRNGVQDKEAEVA